jgi:hypothetical protein
MAEKPKLSVTNVGRDTTNRKLYQLRVQSTPKADVAFRVYFRERRSHFWEGRTNPETGRAFPQYTHDNDTDELHVSDFRVEFVEEAPTVVATATITTAPSGASAESGTPVAVATASTPGDASAPATAVAVSTAPPEKKCYPIIDVEPLGNRDFAVQVRLYTDEACTIPIGKDVVVEVQKPWTPEGVGGWMDFPPTDEEGKTERTITATGPHHTLIYRVPGYTLGLETHDPRRVIRLNDPKKRGD